MLMPRLDNDLIVSFDQPPNPVQLPGGKAMVRGKLDGLQPKLAGFSLAPDVCVNRLIAIKAVKEKPVGSSDVLDSGHSTTLSFYQQCPRNFHSLRQPHAAFKPPTYSVLSLMRKRKKN
jgi:hypothetical protein